MRRHTGSARLTCEHFCDQRIGASHCYRGDHGPGARRQGNGDGLDDVRAGFAEEGEDGAPGGLRQDPGRAVESPAEARAYGNGGREMRVLLSTYDTRGGVEPLAGLTVRLRALGAEVRC
jgi:hypothetical protein